MLLQGEPQRHELQRAAARVRLPSAGEPCKRRVHAANRVADLAGDEDVLTFRLLVLFVTALTVSVCVAVAMPTTCMYSCALTLTKLPTTSPPLVSVVSAAASASTRVAWTPATPRTFSAVPAEPSVACRLTVTAGLVSA